MDLPRVFPTFETGAGFRGRSVIDNVPITFPANDGCDLIFILPLNADFEQAPNNTSMSRVVSGHGTFDRVFWAQRLQMIYLYNELAALREHVATCKRIRRSAGRSPHRLPLRLARRNKPIAVFAVCPQKSFVQETLNTQELWKNKQAETAFEVMDEATKSILSSFKFDARKRRLKSR